VHFVVIARSFTDAEEAMAAETIDHLRDLLVLRKVLVKKRADLKLTHVDLELDEALEVRTSGSCLMHWTY